MLKRLKIKTQIAMFVAISLGIIVILQIVLYGILQKENKNVISKIFDSTTQNTMQQIYRLNNNIAESSFLLATHDFIQESLYAYTPIEVFKNYNLVQDLLDGHLETNQNIAFIGVIKDNGIFASVERIALRNKVREITSDIPTTNNCKSVFLPTFCYENKIYFTCITPIFPIKVEYLNTNNIDNYIVCVYEINTYYTHSDILDNSINLVITDNNDRILLSPDISEHFKVFNFDYLNKKHLFKTTPLPDTNWKVTLYMPNKHISIFSRLTLLFIVFFIIFTILILFLILKLLNNCIIKRIEVLNNKVAKIPQNDTGYRISYDFNDEFTGLVMTINNILDNVHNLNNEKIVTLNALYNAQLLQKETQILYLHGQVSPHFLYNSLSYIQGISLEHNVPEISDMVESLSKVFRYYSNNASLSNIQQDLNCAIEYFNVINLRRTNPITLINNVDHNVYNIKCLKMIYQPILENTLKHAFKLADSGTIIISSVPHETKAIIEIKDNGRGISRERLDEIKQLLTAQDLSKIQDSNHIGLLNINLRLKLYYKNKDCGIDINSVENEGTTVRIVFDKTASYNIP